MPIGRGPAAGVSTGSASACSTPSTCASSPLSYISVTMSQPPTNSPLTKSCGTVGQFDSAESSWRMRGSGRMSTAANGAPVACSAWTVRMENPHAGISGVPFMKRMTSLSRIASAIASRRGFSVCSDMRKLLRGLGLHAQRVDWAADLAGEDVHHELVLLDAAQAREGGRHDGGPEVVTAARPVLYVGAGFGYRGLDALLDLVGRRHLLDTG